MSEPESFDLQYAALGLRPYVLIELKAVEDGGDYIDLALDVSFGGGLDRATGTEILKMALEELEN